MPRPKLSKKEKDEHKKALDKAYNDKRLIDSNGQKISYSEYLKDKGTKQLKLSLPIEMDSALRQYCTQEGIKPQKYILELIEDALKSKGAINGENAATTEE